MEDNVLKFIGLMRRASRISIGMEAVSDCCRSHCARLIAVAQDAGKNTLGAVRNAMPESKAQMVTLPYSKAEIGAVLGRAECAVFAITNTGFARALCEKLGLDEEEGTLQERQEREIRRKKKKTDRQELARKEQAAKSSAKRTAAADEPTSPPPSAAAVAQKNRIYAQRRTGVSPTAPRGAGRTGAAPSRTFGASTKSTRPTGGYKSKSAGATGSASRTAFSHGNKRGK